ncbi:nucleoporin Nup186/Nup192/Nup205 [Sphaerosporella brunnea]|uniref:Nucleoporin Nup186/Nup192/Nup205 n=1 Tax=Sphaerosporella brunnea TaxID=1250544 RepID=A0A5J5F289_9PEZI|nr:nucleoporin Nup186/Nup192/Nup205 [Sphaerosporella brunnea]
MATTTALVSFDGDDELQQLSDVLAVLPRPNEVQPEGLRQLLDARIEDLKTLLDHPPKNDQSRKKLQEGKLTIAEKDYSINEVFQQEAIQLADDFNMDELLAAHLLMRGQEQSEALDRTPLQAARFLYHSRRKCILDSIRLILAYLVDDKTANDTRNLLASAAEKLVAPVNGVSFMDRCISAMVTVKLSVQQLRDKEKHAQTLRIPLDPANKEDLDLQIRMLRNQHEALAIIIYYLVKYRRVGVADFRRLIDVLKGLDRYDVFTAHYILPLFASISALCGTESPLQFEGTIQLHKEILKNYTESPWLLRYCQAAMLAWWLSEFNGLCNDPPPGNAPSKASLDYYADIHNPAKTALKDGALEFLMGLAADLGPAPRLNSAKEDLHKFLQARVPPLEDVVLLLSEFRALLMSQLELFIDGFIANMATLLQAMKTVEEEDDIMNLRTYDYELERFFLIVHYVYDGRIDAGITFWSDPESNLYGFLVWAAKNQTPFMVATFCYMLASLAQGNECAESAHKFLNDEGMLGANRNRRGESLNWAFIFKHVRVYLSELEKRKQALVPNQTYRAPPPPVEAVEPAPHLSMELDGMLRLTSQIVTDCPQAREWLKGNAEFSLLVALFDLLGLQASTQLWDSIFSTITALLTDKDEAFRDKVWHSLDPWAMGSHPPSTQMPLGASTAVAGPFSQTATDNFDLIIQAVHPAEAFVRLLARLVEPHAEVADLKDTVPFPENLGSSNRTTGMEPYVDFVLGTIFPNTTTKNLPRDLSPITDREETVSEKLSRVQYRRFRPALQLSCLQFIHVCLASFNDDLLEMAHKGITVDSGMHTSSLLTYAKLHPFGRVMEHLLTEKCLNVLFEILQLGVEDLSESIEPPISVVDTVLFAIQILDLAIVMQPTYLRVVRPFVKQEVGVRRKAITGNTFEKLEKAVNYRLDVVVDLGVFVGASRQEIVLASITLLEKFCISPEFMNGETVYGRKPHINRALAAIDQSSESKRIIFNFIHLWEYPDEFEAFPLKMPILRFLDSILASQPDSYTLAHLLLGFGYDPVGGISLSTAPGGVGSGVSLLHCILYAALETTEYANDQGQLTYVPAYTALKHACFSVLSRLWSSPLTSGDVMYVLRMNKFFLGGFSTENSIKPTTLWGTHPSRCRIEPTPEFFSEGAFAFVNFLSRRSKLFEYTALEIRQLNRQGASTSVQRCLSTLLGNTIAESGSQTDNVHILDLLDFLEFVFPGRTRQPQVQWLKDGNLLTFQEEDPSGVALFDLDKIVEFLQIRINALLKSGVVSPEQKPALEEEAEVVRAHLFCENQLRRCRHARLQCLRSWATLVRMMLEDCDIERMSKTAFILQALQAVLTKLEIFSVDDVEAAEVLSEFAHSLISHISFDTSTFGYSRGSDLANDRLYQLFRVSLRCIQSPAATPKLREDFYSIALRYLLGMAVVYEHARINKRHNIQTIRASGEKLLEVICNDAYSGEGTCKIVSLLLLEALAAVAEEEGSVYVVDALTRKNFLVVLVDSIKNIGDDLWRASSEEIPTVMKAFEAATGFLLRVAQTRSGAGQVINAGLFQALRDCQLFKADPDLGIDFPDPQKLQKYYELLLDIMRVVVACIVSRGAQNRQVIEAAKIFVRENWNLGLTIFKRNANINGKAQDAVGDVKELTKLFVLLYTLTGVLEDVSFKSLHLLA